MRFGTLSEADTPDGMTHYHRYHEQLEEAAFADSLGFDFWGVSEQHFLPTTSSISAPETFFAAVAARTRRIKLRFLSVVMLPFNHPVRVAERLATLDILSDGRVELCTARSNSPFTLDVFGVDPNETRSLWREGTEATIRALTEDPFEFKGQHYTIPPRSVTPKLYRDEMFPVMVIGTSLESCEIAGANGLGVMTHDSWGGWEYIEKCAQLYKGAIENAEPFAPYPVTNSLGYAVATANCDADVERAYRTARHIAEGFISLGMHMYAPLVKASESYSAFAQLEDVYEHRDDLEYVMDKTPSVLLGKPDKFIATIERLQALGFDEVAMRIDGYGHEQNMRNIEMIGKYVIPHFRAKSAIVPSQYRTELNVQDVPQYLI
ncbi:LLM class flavin-dependent oxidoreductase [Mycolicibacterium sp. XJ1819]